MRHPGRIPGSWLVLVLGLVLLRGAMAAAEIKVQVDRNPVPLDESFRITFQVEGDFDGQPDFSPLEKDFQVLGTSRSQRTSFINGKVSRSVEFLVSAMPRRTGRLTIPAIAFGSRKSPPLTIRVVPAGQGGQAAQVKVEAKVDVSRPYLQQQVILTVRILHRIRWREASLSEPSFRGGEVLVEKLGDDRTGTLTRDGVQWNLIERRYALFPQASGTIEINPLLLTMRVPSGQRAARQRSPFGDPFFDDFFSRMNYVRKVVRSNGLTLHVQPVPAAFKGSHWLPARHVQLQERWSDDPDKLRAGEPVTRTITLRAEGVSLGQLPSLDLPKVPNLRIYPDDPETREERTSSGVVSILTRKFAIIPEHPGEYRLPELAIHWWNVATDREETTRLTERRLQVTGTAATAPPQAPATPAPAQSKTPAAVPQGAKRDLAAPSVSTQPIAGVNRWLLVGLAVLAVAWLVTLAAWWRTRRALAAKAQRSPSMPKVQSCDTSEAWRRLEQAADGDDPAALAQALLAVAPLVWPEDPPRNLGAMARRLDGEPAAWLRALDSALYGGKSVAEWNGPALVQALRGYKQNGRHRDGADRSEPLPTLYPEG